MCFFSPKGLHSNTWSEFILLVLFRIITFILLVLIAFKFHTITGLNVDRSSNGLLHRKLAVGAHVDTLRRGDSRDHRLKELGEQIEVVDAAQPRPPRVQV